MERASFVVVGGGIAGLATAWALARRGARGVVLLERERELATHSTALNAAILRTPMPDPLTEALSLEGAEFLRAPPRGFSDAPLLDACGLVIASARPREALLDWERRLDARSDVERLSPARLAALAPHFAGGVASAWYLAGEGRIENAALVRGFADGARALGVRIETGAKVREIEVEDGAVRGVALADGRAIASEQLILAAGGWAARLGARAGSRVRLRPTRRHLLVGAADSRVDPRWPIVWTDADPFYARPESGGRMVCACDQVDVDPDRLAAVDAERDAIERKCERWLPSLGRPRPARFWPGVRTLTADDRFVIGRDRDVAGLGWVAGLGGHGMTCAAPIGRLAAEAFLGGASDPDVHAALSPARPGVRVDG